MWGNETWFRREIKCYSFHTNCFHLETKLMVLRYDICARMDTLNRHVETNMPHAHLWNTEGSMTLKCPHIRRLISRQVCTHLSLQESLDVSLKSVTTHSPEDFFFMYPHTVQLTWDNQKKSNDSAFIQLGEEEIVLIDQMSCEEMSLFFHKKS